MTQIIIENLDPIVVEKLQLRSTIQGRNLTEQLKEIIEEAVSSETFPPRKETLSAARQRLTKVREKYEGRIFRDSTELLRKERQL